MKNFSEMYYCGKSCSDLDNNKIARFPAKVLNGDFSSERKAWHWNGGGLIPALLLLLFLIAGNVNAAAQSVKTVGTTQSAQSSNREKNGDERAEGDMLNVVQGYQIATILATGYENLPPAFLKGIKDRISFDDKGRPNISRNYAIDKTSDSI